MYQQSRSLACSSRKKNWFKPAQQSRVPPGKQPNKINKYNKINSVHKSSLSFIHSNIVLGGKTFLSLYEIFLGLVSPLSGSVADTTLI